MHCRSSIRPSLAKSDVALHDISSGPATLANADNHPPANLLPGIFPRALELRGGVSNLKKLALCNGECQALHCKAIPLENSRKSLSMKFSPLHDRVLVRRIEGDEKTAGGLIIPDSAKEKPQEGEIVAVGTGERKDSGDLIPMSVKAGDMILFGKWSGTEIKLDGEELLIMKESDILGVITEKSGKAKKAA